MRERWPDGLGLDGQERQIDEEREMAQKKRNRLMDKRKING